MPKIAFTVPGVPRGKGRPRSFKRGNFVGHYTPAETSAYENRIMLFFNQAAPGHQPIAKPMPITLKIFAYFPIPKSFSKRRHQECYEYTGKPDNDNINKCIDALNKVAWEDDSQVWSTHIEKVYTTAQPKLEMIIEWGEEGVLVHPPGLGPSSNVADRTSHGDLDIKYRVNNSSKSTRNMK